jgi:tetratricopeptide (TPR) repeat protein
VVTIPSPPVLPTTTELTPQEAAALRFVEVGKRLLEQGDLDRAQEQFERAVSLAPLQPYSYFFLGRIAFSRGDHKQALAFLRKAELSFAPRERTWLSEATGLQGAIYEELGEYEHARAAYQRCLQLTPTNLKALSALARLSEEEPLPSDTFPHRTTTHPWD